jgi:hypothetical protein
MMLNRETTNTLILLIAMQNEYGLKKYKFKNKNYKRPVAHFNFVSIKQGYVTHIKSPRVSIKYIHIKLMQDLRVCILVALPKHKICLFFIILPKPFKPICDSAMAHVPIYVQEPSKC